ncbi:MAG: ABC transporter ATP-binding protein [Candidatus Paceibacterota bacterium]|jgi:ABC-type nitrate/sulfonate/bicarbonate transport system ATPase subunit
MNQISVKNLSVRYDGQPVLAGINLEVKKGEFIAIVGQSGSGKTTFLHALAKFIPFWGEIFIPKNIGMLFQNYAVFPWLTVAENIDFGAGGKDIGEYIRLAELEGKENRYPAELSGGQVQRVALARSLAANPEVLLMDEPYGALDAYTRDKMQQWLLDIWQTHQKTIIFVTHNIEEAIFLADRVLVLSDHRFSQEYRIPFARPRDLEVKFSPEFVDLRQRIFENLIQNS